MADDELTRLEEERADIQAQLAGMGGPRAGVAGNQTPVTTTVSKWMLGTLDSWTGKVTPVMGIDGNDPTRNTVEIKTADHVWKPFEPPLFVNAPVAAGDLTRTQASSTAYVASKSSY